MNALTLMNPEGLYDPAPNGYSHVASVVPDRGWCSWPVSAALGVGPNPACTLVPAPRLALDGMLFEVEAVAVLPA